MQITFLLSRCARFAPRGAAAWLVALPSLAMLGCGSSDSVPLHPVRGKVLFEGQPVPNALVVLHPTKTAEPGKDSLRPRAQAGADGTFEVETVGSKDGAPAGEYAVTVQWFLTSARKGGEDDPPPTNRLPVRYASAQTSGLRVQVEPGDNEIPTIHLRRQAP